MTYKDFCEDLARKAGAIMKNNFSKPMEKEWKADNSPVTITDKEINRLIISEINKKYPDHDIHGEEESSFKNNSEYIWVCDPVDGTIPFSHGMPISTFSLALVHNGIPIVGVIYDPWIDRLYYAEKNNGALLNNKPINVNNSESLNLKVIGAATPKNSELDIDKLMPILRDTGAKLFEIPSIIYQGMLVASGEFSAVLFGGDTCHDAAALKIIIEEAGGKFTCVHGNEQRYDQPIKGFIASNKILHEQLVEMTSKIL